MKKLLYLEFFGISIVPPLLLFTGVISLDYDFLVLIGVLLFAVSTVTYRIKKRIWKYEDIGFIFPVRGALIWYASFFALGIVTFGIVTYFSNAKIPLTTFVLYSGAGSPIQEFLYRSYLFALGGILFRPTINIVLNFILFVWMHIFYPDTALVLLLATVGGFIFLLLYRKHKNFFLVAVVHMIFNLIYLKLVL